MSKLKLFIWEGDGISDAYHDDGTLVVLASTPDEARKVITDALKERAEKYLAWTMKRDELMSRSGQPIWSTPEGEAHLQNYVSSDGEGKGSDFFDGSIEALSREPDRVIEIDKPKWVAFNGGGYD